MFALSPARPSTIVVLCLSSSTVLVFAFFVFFGFLAIINDSKTNLDLSLLTFNGVCCCCCSLRYDSIRFSFVWFYSLRSLGFIVVLCSGCLRCHLLLPLVAHNHTQCRALQHGGYDDIKNPNEQWNYKFL